MTIVKSNCIALHASKLKRNTYKLLMQIKQEEKVVLTDGKVISVDDIMDLEVLP